jgi:hypothetical protein
MRGAKPPLDKRFDVFMTPCSDAEGYHLLRCMLPPSTTLHIVTAQKTSTYTSIPPYVVVAWCLVKQKTLLQGKLYLTVEVHEIKLGVWFS